MSESVIERFASTPEGEAMLAEAEDRLSSEWAAMSELRAAAVRWWRGLHDDSTTDEMLTAEDRLEEAAKAVAELEETCSSET